MKKMYYSNCCVCGIWEKVKPLSFTLNSNAYLHRAKSVVFINSTIRLLVLNCYIRSYRCREDFLTFLVDLKSQSWIPYQLYLDIRLKNCIGYPFETNPLRFQGRPTSTQIQSVFCLLLFELNIPHWPCAKWWRHAQRALNHNKRHRAASANLWALVWNFNLFLSWISSELSRSERRAK